MQGILGHDAHKSSENMSKETSRTKIQKMKSKGKTHDKSLSIMKSESKKLPRKSSEVQRVAFADDEPTTDGSSDEESIEKTIVTDSRNVEIASTMETNEEPLVIDNHDTLREIQVRTKRHLGSQAEISRSQVDRASRIDEIDNESARENTKRSTIFLGHTIEGLLAQNSRIPRSGSYRQGNNEFISPSAIENSTPIISAGRARPSENIGVRSMLFEFSKMDCLSALEAGAIGIVLRETLELLEIFKHVIPARVDERWNESYKTIDEKYGTPKEPEIMFRTDMGLLPLIPTVPEKIQRDRTYVYNVLKGTARDIQCSKRYDRLETEVDDITRILEGERNLEINNELWMDQVEQLRELIESDRLSNEEEIKNLLVSAQEMNAEVDNAIFSNSSKLGYVKRWEEARLDQKKMHLELREQEMNDALENCATMERADQIVSGEVRTFLQENTRDLEEDMVAWTSRHNEEIERVQQKINKMKEKIELQKLDINNLEELRDERQIFIEKCYEEKELADRNAEYWDAVNNAAVLIQTPWRGYMVRHKLGQFKKLWDSFGKKKNKKKKPKGKKGRK